MSELGMIGVSLAVEASPFGRGTTRIYGLGSGGELVPTGLRVRRARNAIEARRGRWRGPIALRLEGVPNRRRHGEVTIANGSGHTIATVSGHPEHGPETLQLRTEFSTLVAEFDENLRDGNPVLAIHKRADRVGEFAMNAGREGALELQGAREVSFEVACGICIDLFEFFTNWGARDALVDGVIETMTG